MVALEEGEAGTAWQKEATVAKASFLAGREY